MRTTTSGAGKPLTTMKAIDAFFSPCTSKHVLDARRQGRNRFIWRTRFIECDIPNRPVYEQMGPPAMQIQQPARPAANRRIRTHVSLSGFARTTIEKEG